MSRPHRLGTFCTVASVGFLSLLLARVDAAPAPAGTFDDAHTRVSATQPAGLSMELKLPKTRFFQGELIPATLVFRNDSQRPFFTWIGTYDRSGRIPDLGFRAVGEDGQAVSDPLQIYFKTGRGIRGGLGNESDLGQWEITLPINQWLRFDKPGTYRLYGWSHRVKTGHKEDVHLEGEAPPAAVELVSQIVTVQIDWRTPEQEQEVMTQAKIDLASDKDEVRREAVERLCYLQTPAAREMLVPLVGKPDAFDAGLALVGAPDPAAEADRLLQAVASGRLSPNGNVIHFYSQLKEASASPGETLVNRNPFALQEDAQTELFDAAKAALRLGSWNADSYETLLAMFQQNPDDPQTHLLLVERQMDLPAKAADELLRMFDEEPTEEWLESHKDFPPGRFHKIDRHDFLPLARRAVGPPQCSALALKLLARLVPAEAREVVVANVQHPPFRHREHFGDPHYGRNPQVDLAELMSLPDDMLLPELDDALRQRLDHPTEQNSDSDEGIESTMLLTARYGSPALLRDMLRVYLPGEGQWYCAIQSAALRFWMRCDPPAGAQAVARALQYRKDTGCYKFVLTDVLQKHWHDEALPVVLAALDDESEEVWLSAAEVLDHHAVAPAVTAKMIVTLERVSGLPLPTLGSERSTSIYRQNQVVKMLLKNESRGLTREQLSQLKALPNNQSDVRQQIDQKLAQTAR